MNVTAIRQRPQWLVLGIVISAAVVGGVLRVMLAEPYASPTTSKTSTESVAETTEVELFDSPMVNLSAEMRKAATPSELVRSTATEDRLSAVTTGRLDPFAPITQTISATTSSGAATAETPSANNAQPITPSLPTASVSSTPDLPPVPNVVNVAPPRLPSIPVASNPLPIPALPSSLPTANPVPRSPVEAIELTGVIHVGDRVGVIIRENNGQSSRHIFQGDRIAGGQVRVKAIDLSGREPIVILEYQGEEYTRMVG